MNQEIQLYEQIAQYMNLKYPKVIFHFDLSGLWTPSHKARNLYGRLNRRAWPDLFIATSGKRYEQIDSASIAYAPNATWLMRTYCGLFLELKREGTILYKKDGTLRANTHHEEQAAVLQQLREQGYKAEFSIGFDESIKIIDDYLS